MDQIFYDPATGQVMAVYRGCRYGGTKWQDDGFLEAKSRIPVTRDMTVTVRGMVVTDTAPSINPTQPDQTPPATFKDEVKRAIKELNASGDIVGIVVR